MPDPLTAKELAARVGVNTTTVARHARLGKFCGAELWAGRWRIPARYADPATYRAAVGAWGGARKADHGR